jgi:hypothetical protein
MWQLFLKETYAGIWLIYTASLNWVDVGIWLIFQSLHLAECRRSILM